MKTANFDVAALLQSRIKNHPANSVSRRDVVATIISDESDKDIGWELNGVLTKAVYSHWNAANLHKPRPWPDERALLTKSVCDAVEQSICDHITASEPM